jgi:hypothetical protein
MIVFYLAGAVFIPRLMIVLLWLFTSWFDGIFTSILWAIVGFIFLPATLLWYTAVYNWYDNNWGTFQIVILVIAIIIDLSPASHKKKRKDR